MDKISIIIPIYNVKRYLDRCVESAVAQTYANIEIILVDDRSTDGSLALAEAWCSQCADRCRLVRRAENGGTSAARNSGLDCAVGDWLVFLDSDDWLAPDYCELMLKTAHEKNAEIVACSYYLAHEERAMAMRSALHGISGDAGRVAKVAMARNMACTLLISSACFRRSKLKFPVDLRRGEDIPVTIPLMMRAEAIAVVEKPLYYYYQRPDSQSSFVASDTDLGFYSRAFAMLEENSLPGYETVVEFRGIQEMVYGMTLLQVASGKSGSDIKNNLARFDAKYPNWRNNPYISKLPRGKRLFIAMAAFKAIWLIRLLVRSRNLLLRLRGGK